MTTWWQRLRDRLAEQGMSQADLARASGVSHANVRKYLSGAVQHPKGDNLGKLARSLHVSEQWVLFGHEALGQNAYRDEEIPWGEIVGAAVEALKEKSRKAGVSEPSEATFRARAPDASMAPLIPEGAEIHCRWRADAAPNDVVIVLIGKAAAPVIRRFREIAVDEDGEVTVALTAENPAFAEYRLKKGVGYRVLAQVTHVTRPI